MCGLPYYDKYEYLYSHIKNAQGHHGKKKFSYTAQFLLIITLIIL